MSDVYKDLGKLIEFVEQLIIIEPNGDNHDQWQRWSELPQELINISDDAEKLLKELGFN